MPLRQKAYVDVDCLDGDVQADVVACDARCRLVQRIGHPSFVAVASKDLLTITASHPQPVSVSERTLHNAASIGSSTELKKSRPMGILRHGLFLHVLRIMLESVEHPQR
jgi:hypothetical protein